MSKVQIRRMTDAERGDWLTEIRNDVDPTATLDDVPLWVAYKAGRVGYGMTEVEAKQDVEDGIPLPPGVSFEDATRAILRPVNPAI